MEKGAFYDSQGKNFVVVFKVFFKKKQADADDMPPSRLPHHRGHRAARLAPALLGLPFVPRRQ